MDEQFEDLLKLAQAQRLRKINDELTQIRNQSNGPPCPHCGGSIPRLHVKLCMHCRNPLSWVESTPCEPGKESQTRAQMKQQEIERTKREAAQAVERKRRTKKRLVISVTLLGISLLTILFCIYAYYVSIKGV